MEKSTHRVEVVRINEIEKHPNADSLGIVRVYGYTCCVRLGDFHPGDLVAYVVPDSVVPTDVPAFAFLNGHKRITVKRLRGVCSQGLLIKAPEGAKEGDDVAPILGVTRYEPPCAATTGGEAEAGPPGIVAPKYDLESWHRYKHLLHDGEPVIVTEKIHGACGRYVWAGERLYCGSRTEWKRESDENLWWIAARTHGWIEQFCRSHPGTVLYGEVFGQVQDLKYGIPRGGRPRFAAFDLFQPQGHQWSFPPEHLALSTPPVIYRGPYKESEIVALSQGRSLVDGADNLREGIVIEPAETRIDIEIGRVKLKVVSDEYLERSK